MLHDGSLTSCLGTDRERGAEEGNILLGNIKTLWDNGFQRNRCKTYRTCGTHPYEEVASQ